MDVSRYLNGRGPMGLRTGLGDRDTGPRGRPLGPAGLAIGEEGEENLGQPSTRYQGSPIASLFAGWRDFIEPLTILYRCGSVALLKWTMVRVVKEEWDRWNPPGRPRYTERHEDVRGVLLDYWHTGAGVKWITRKQLGRKAFQAEWFWSAAFISWVIKKAGAGTRFKYSHKHSAYIVWARDNREKKKDNPFWAYRIDEVKPEMGDLVCKWRKKKATYKSIKDSMYTHCDIVTEVSPKEIVTIGGNVKGAGYRWGQSVTKTVLKLNSKGYVDTTGKQRTYICDYQSPRPQY